MTGNSPAPALSEPAPPEPPASAPAQSPGVPPVLEPQTAAVPASSRPLVLWDGDPAGGGALVLARFPAGQVDEALRVAAVWARRYASLTLAEAALPGESPHVLARWQDGVQVAL